MDKIESGNYILITVTINGQLSVKIGHVWTCRIEVSLGPIQIEKQKPIGEFVALMFRENESKVSFSHSIESIKDRTLFIPFDGMSAPFTTIQKGSEAYGWLNKNFKRKTGLYLFSESKNYDISKELIQSALDNKAKQTFPVYLVTDKGILNNSKTIDEILGVELLSLEAIQYLKDSLRMKGDV